MTIRIAVSAAALLGLAACGGGGDSSIGSEAASRFVALDAEFDRVVDANPILAAPSIPSSGTADFSGVMLVGSDLQPGTTTPAYLGDTSITVNFDSGALTGEANSFVFVDLNAGINPQGVNTSVGNDGAVTSTDVMFTATVTGVDFSPEFSGFIDEKELSGTASGEFLGTSAEYIQIFESCASCDFEFDGNPTDLVVWATED